MHGNKSLLLTLAAGAVILSAVVFIYSGKNKSRPTPSPTESTQASNATSWEEGKKLIAGCKVQQTTELHNGTLRLDLTDGTDRSIKPYNQEELYQVVQTVPAKCGFPIIIATE